MDAGAEAGRPRRVCVDVGGTFTDCLVLDGSGALAQFKAPTTPADPADGFIGALAKAARHYGEGPEEFLATVDILVHGTTLATNTLLTGTGARLGMLTTRNFRDVLEIRRAIKPVDVSLYNVFIPPNRPLVPRSRRLGVTERTLYTGEIVDPLDEAETAAATETLVASGVEAVAICFLHSYANGANERRAAEIVRDAAPGIYVTTSHETLPVWREFERFNTTVVGAYVGPGVTRYLTSLEARLRDNRFGGSFLMMLTNGLVQTVDQCLGQAVYLLHSGPAAAPAAAVHLGRLGDETDLLSIDMGGTSFDICLVRGGEIPTTTESWVGDQRIGVKMVDIETVGAGGGSIADVDSLGLLKVGPESAGADPGPACYGRGDRPTVTDADLVLGYVPADYFLGGEIALDARAAERAVATVAEPLGLDTVAAARAIFDLVNARMANKITEVSTQRGHDVRDFTVVAGGGAGAVHAGFIAEILGARRVIVPSVSALYSAFGMFAMDLGQDHARSFASRIEGIDVAAVDRHFREMEDDARAAFAAIGIDGDAIALRRTMEMRHVGQFHEVETEVDGGPVTAALVAAAVERFVARHGELYSFTLPWKAVEVLTLRVKATVANAPFELEPAETGTGNAAHGLKRRRPAHFGGRMVDTPVYDGEALLAGDVLDGPAIVEQPTTTLVVPGGFRCAMDGVRNFVLTRSGGDRS